MTDLAAIKQLARQWKKGGHSPAKLTQAVTCAHLDRSPAIWDEINAHLDHNPGFGLALARVTQSLAAHRRNPELRAQANLALIRALNVCGEFREAIGLCEDTACRLERLDDFKRVAWVWLEAAWAETYLGHLDRAEDYMQRARSASLPDEVFQVRSDWIAARILRLKGGVKEALLHFEQIHARLLGSGNAPDATRLLYEIGRTRTRVNPSDGLRPLEQAREFFRAENYPADVALCDHLLAQAYMDADRLPEAHAALARAQKAFRAHALRFFDAYCDLDLGFLLCSRDRFQESLQASERARAVFIEMDAVQEVSSCDVNIGWALMRLNRYSEALAHFQSAVEIALGTGRQTKAAVCLSDMGWIYEKQGHYAQALEHLQQSRDIFVNAGMSERLIECDLNLGPLYFQLGAFDQALEVLDRARQACQSEKMDAKLGECELHRAHVLLALGKTPDARRALAQASALFARNQQTVFAAFCDRLRARLDSGTRRSALTWLEASHCAFTENRLIVDAALCDLTRAELELEWQEWDAARRDLTKARRVLNKGFPDQAWRIEYAGGKIAESQNQPTRARRHYLCAAETIAGLRGDLQVESLSDTLFGARQFALDDGLRFTQKRSLESDSLYLIETAKAQTFLHHLAVRDWRAPQGERAAPGPLYTREQELRNQLDEKRAAVAVQMTRELENASVSPQRPLLRSAAALADLDTLEQKYEDVATRLRLAPRGLAGTPTLEPFQLARFREMAEARWGTAWGALDYYFAKGRLYIGYVDASHVQVFEHSWSTADQHILDRCAATNRDLRELMYRGTLNGAVAPFDSRPFLQQMTVRLIPPAILQDRRERTLIISPHGQLHQVPFHALLTINSPLLERFTFLYTPSLQALTQLEGPAAAKKNPTRWLVCGVGDFAGPRGPLPHTRTEIQAVCVLAGKKACVWWQQDATRDNMFEWNRAGQLRSFDVLHFATHAKIAPGSPHSSHIMLADRDLTVLDILDLDLDARLVTLSGCSSAEGQAGRGDELLGLTRAFMYAGVRALVASLWQVEDESTAQLMASFYQNLKEDMSIAQALRQAQLMLYRQGYKPFQWAPFIALGAA